MIETATRSVEDLLAWKPQEIPRVRYLLGLRRFWMTDLYRDLRSQYEDRMGDSASAGVEDVKTIVDELPSLSLFLWLDGHIQTRLWEEVGWFADARLDEAESILEARDGDLGELQLDPHLDYPDYYEFFDFHRQPGGIWRDVRGALIYALGARVIHVGKNDAFELHDAFAEAVPRDDPRRVLDLGCGFGKTTFSMKKRYPDSEVIGLDLSEPCLRLGRRMATESGLEISWKQGAVESIPEEDGSVDVVTMSMLLHEMPMKSVHKTLTEALRVLAPGGVLVAFEPWVTGDPFRDLLGDYHSEVTGEPYIAPLRRTDLAALCKDLGFADAEMGGWTPPGAPAVTEVSDDRWATAWGKLTARKAG